MAKPAIYILLFGLAPAICGAQKPDPDNPAPLRPDPPLVRRPEPGQVTGTIEPGGKVVQIRAISRVTGKQYAPSAFDRQTGRFAFEALPGAAAYDLCIETRDGRRIEGIDLRFVDQRLLDLAEKRRKQLDMPPPPGHTFTREDAETVAAFVAKQEDFMDWGRALYVRGHGRYATALVELMRTRAFHAGVGQVIWRVELWYFEYQGGGWERLNNQERVLRRERLGPAAWKKIHVEYTPDLSVHVDRAGASKPVRFRIPEAPDPATARPAGTKPRLPARPKLLGIQEETPPAEKP